MARARDYCFTLNNYTQEQYNEVLLWDCKYLVVGREIGESRTPHLQGYVSFENSKTLTALKKLGSTIHWEKRRGTPTEASDYCKKDDVAFYEKGVMPLSSAQKGEAEKARWDAAFDSVASGNLDSVPKDILCNHLKSIEYAVNRVRVSKRKLETLEGEMEHEWYVGETGSGKSRQARLENPGAYIKDPQSIWWNDYEGQEVVIIDDFDKFQVKQGGDMKRWLDRYPFQAQVKGGQMLIRPRKLIVTSQYKPCEIWDDERTVDAVMRRVKVKVFAPQAEYSTSPPLFARSA